jgi:dTMP kinase
MRITPEQFAPTTAKGFLVVDGVNGAGKTTLLNAISQQLEDLGLPFLRTREPGPKTELGEAVRKLLLDARETVTPIAELFLFGADRAEHVQKIILPAIAAGTVVLADRYYYSTFAFQGKGRGLPVSLVETVNRSAVSQTYPDLAILLDLPPEIGLQRTKSRESGKGDAAERDSFEEEEIAFHERLREGFLEKADSCSEPVLVIDATRSPEEIFSEISPLIERFALALQNNNTSAAG